MDEILKTLGQLGGIGGIAVGISLLILRDMIGKINGDVSPEAYKFLRHALYATWSVAAIGMLFLASYNFQNKNSSIKFDLNGKWESSPPGINGTIVHNGDVLYYESSKSDHTYRGVGIGTIVGENIKLVFFSASKEGVQDLGSCDGFVLQQKIISWVCVDKNGSRIEGKWTRP